MMRLLLNPTIDKIYFSTFTQYFNFKFTKIIQLTIISVNLGSRVLILILIQSKITATSYIPAEIVTYHNYHL